MCGHTRMPDLESRLPGHRVQRFLPCHPDKDESSSHLKDHPRLGYIAMRMVPLAVPHANAPTVVKLIVARRWIGIYDLLILDYLDSI